MPITELSQVREGQLTWPETKPRTAHRRASPFRTGLDKAQRDLEEEMAAWGVREYVISRNRQRIYAGDPAVAVWWQQRRKSTEPYELRVLACDRWDNMGHNLHAISLTLTAMRALERWGAYTAEQAAEGARIALPPPAGMERVDWKTKLGYVSGLPNDKQLVLAEHSYRSLSKQAFAKGDDAEQTRLNLAMEAARSELSPNASS